MIMISQSDILVVVLAFLIGYLDDYFGPQAYHYENRIVIVDKKYQCPIYCGADHSHSVYYDGQSIGMVIDSTKLGKKHKPPKKKN